MPNVIDRFDAVRVRSLLRLVAVICLGLVLAVPNDDLFAAADKEPSTFLFTSFRGNGEDGLCLAYSFDGYCWTNLTGTFLTPQVGKLKLMRDPSLLRTPDGTFHLVWTTGWRDDPGFGYARSRDLLQWSDQKFVPVMAHEPTTCNVWAPELFYDDRAKHIIVCWASTIPGRFPDYLEARTNNHRMYFTTTTDFQKFAPTKLFYDPGFSVIDACIVNDAKRFVLVHKDNSRPQLCLRVAFGNSPMGPWGPASEPFTQKFTEGPTVLKIRDEWLIYFDAYRANAYGAVKTRDFRTFKDISSEVSLPEGHKHGTAIAIPREVLKPLLNRNVTPAKAPIQ
jgi:hypothetical protein